MAGARRTARSALAGAVTRRYGLHRQRPGAGRPREAAAATQGFRPEEAVTLPPPAAAAPRRREPLSAGAAPDRLPGVSRSAPGARRGPSRLARRRRALEAVGKVVTGRHRKRPKASVCVESCLSGRNGLLEHKRVTWDDRDHYPDWLCAVAASP